MASPAWVAASPAHRMRDRRFRHRAVGSHLIVKSPLIIFNERFSFMKSLLIAALAVFCGTVHLAAQEAALDGHCAVCLVEMGKYVPGSEKHAITFDRKTYFFPSEKELKMFAGNPAKYTPALGGDCAVCRVEMGARVAGKPEFTQLHDGRVYLFPSAKEMEMFQANPKKYESADVAIQGHCSVCIVKARKWVPGKAEFVSVYDGMRYYFPSASEKTEFNRHPDRYTPALDGDCVVCLKEGGKRMAGKPEFSALHEGRLYLFPDARAQQAFLDNPGKYMNTDIAQDGNCVVCAKMAGKQVPGKTEYTSVYRGLRYLFPTDQERKKFESSPESFVSDEENGSPNQTANVKVVGKTACAGCSYGVKPTTDANSLGIAVVVGDQVYVVEGGENRFPELFAARFDEITVELAGTTVKQKGNIVWVEPTSLRRVSR